MQLQDMFEWYGDFNQHQAGGHNSVNYFSVQRWLQDQTDNSVAVNFGEASEPDGDTENNETTENTKATDDDDDDQPIDIIDIADDDTDKKAHPRHTGPQRVIPHGGFRGAD